MAAGLGFRSLVLWCLVAFLAFTAVCSARQTKTTLPAGMKNDGRLLQAEGRKLIGRTDDYSDPWLPPRFPKPPHAPPEGPPHPNQA